MITPTYAKWNFNFLVCLIFSRKPFSLVHVMFPAESSIHMTRKSNPKLAKNHKKWRVELAMFEMLSLSSQAVGVC